MTKWPIIPFLDIFDKPFYASIYICYIQPQEFIIEDLL